ncbi:MAG: hypothetical protein ACJAT1_000176 [Marivirga sp.]
MDEEALMRTIFQDVQNTFLHYKAAFKRKEVAQNTLQAAYKIQEQLSNAGLSNLSELAFAQQYFVIGQANYNLIFQQRIRDFYVGMLGLDRID